MSAESGPEQQPDLSHTPARAGVDGNELVVEALDGSQLQRVRVELDGFGKALHLKGPVHIPDGISDEGKSRMVDQVTHALEENARARHAGEVDVAFTGDIPLDAVADRVDEGYLPLVEADDLLLIKPLDGLDKAA